MAIGDAYATAAEYRTAIGRTDAGDDAQILLDLNAISRFLEGKLERFFNKDTAAVARTYIPSENVSSLRVDDLAAAPTSILVDDDFDGEFDDETALASSDYELRPLNADKGPEARPFTRIALTPWGGRAMFYKGIRVQVTAQWGWPAVPQAIKTATIHLCAILRLETPRATKRVVELDTVMEASPDAQSIIRQLTDDYRRISYV